MGIGKRSLATADRIATRFTATVTDFGFAETQVDFECVEMCFFFLSLACNGNPTNPHLFAVKYDQLEELRGDDGYYRYTAPEVVQGAPVTPSGACVEALKGGGRWARLMTCGRLLKPNAPRFHVTMRLCSRRVRVCGAWLRGAAWAAVRQRRRDLGRPPDRAARPRRAVAGAQPVCRRLRGLRFTGRGPGQRS